VGSLAHLLKNRFYLGEVPYRGEVHRGEHEPILGRDLFEAVQAKRAANAVARQVRLRGAAAILTGRLFDDRGTTWARRMRTSSACVTGTMCRRRFCRIGRSKQAASPACRPPRSRPSREIGRLIGRTEWGGRDSEQLSRARRHQTISRELSGLEAAQGRRPGTAGRSEAEGTG
jgi:hypothetical protein